MKIWIVTSNRSFIFSFNRPPRKTDPGRLSAYIDATCTHVLFLFHDIKTQSITVKIPEGGKKNGGIQWEIRGALPNSKN